MTSPTHDLSKLRIDRSAAGPTKTPRGLAIGAIVAFVVVAGFLGRDRAAWRSAPAPAPHER